jgi:hypothetical protein
MGGLKEKAINGTPKSISTPCKKYLGQREPSTFDDFFVRYFGACFTIPVPKEIAKTNWTNIPFPFFVEF